MDYRETKNIDYGFRLEGVPVLLYKDHSLVADELTHQTEKVLRQLSMEYYVLDRCLQCGICSNSCPNALLKTDNAFTPRTFIEKTRLGLLDLNSDDLWLCTHCGSCQIVCPFDIPLLDVMAQLRHLVVEKGAGHIPASIKHSISSIASCGNPWKEDAVGRKKWLCAAGLPQADGYDETAVCVFLGCLAGYDRRARQTAEAVMRILQAVGIPFKILADDEVCCGDTVRRIGDFSTAEKVEELNRKNILKNNIETMYVLSPHCFSAFKNFRHPEAIKNVRVELLIDLIYRLFIGGAFHFTAEIEKKVTFHDPCFFSKHLDVVNQPREILRGIPGIEILEMKHHGKKSLCCGGGGGGIWRDAGKGERLAEIRMDEAMETGAQTVVTSCPYCLSMLDDARRGDEKYQNMEIVDLFEFIGEGIRHENH